MVPVILAPLLPFSPHPTTFLKPSPLTTIPHRRVWLNSLQASLSCEYTCRHLFSCSALQVCPAGFQIAPATTQWPQCLPSHAPVSLVKVLSSAGHFVTVSDAGVQYGMPASVPEPAFPSKAEPAEVRTLPFSCIYCHTFLSEDTKSASWPPPTPLSLRAHIK